MRLLARPGRVWAGCHAEGRRFEPVHPLQGKPRSGGVCSCSEIPHDGHRDRIASLSEATTSRLPYSAVTMPSVIGTAVRVHSRRGDDLGLFHVPPFVEIGDVLELGRGPILVLRVVDLVETGPKSPLARGRAPVSPSLCRARIAEVREGGRCAGSVSRTAG